MMPLTSLALIQPVGELVICTVAERLTPVVNVPSASRCFPYPTAVQMVPTAGGAPQFNPIGVTPADGVARWSKAMSIALLGKGSASIANVVADCAKLMPESVRQWSAVRIVCVPTSVPLQSPPRAGPGYTIPTAG